MMMSAPAPLWTGCRHARLDVVLVDALDLDLGAGLLAELPGLGLEQRVGGRDEVRPLQQVQPRALGVRGGAPGGHDPFDAGGGGARESAEVTATESAHGTLHAPRRRGRSA
jgi:hypothetical protein